MATLATDLEGLHNDEDVVHTHSQHKEGDDLDDDEGEGNTDVAEDTQRASNWAKYNQDARYTQRDLRVHLKTIHRQDTRNN